MSGFCRSGHKCTLTKSTITTVHIPWSIIDNQMQKVFTHHKCYDDVSTIKSGSQNDEKMHLINENQS